MRIHGLCVIKNEADIIIQTLTAATRWCDCIYVLDNGSTDGTWSKVLNLAGENSSIQPYKRDARPFTDGIRGEIWRKYRRNACEGDWWCILDADEYYIDNPKEFLNRVPKTYDAVWMAIYTYLFTEKDLDIYQSDPESYGDSPIETRLRYYVIGEYSEARFFRHSSKAWEKFVQETLKVFPERIRMKHFAYRSPEQIQLRLETRWEPMARGDFVHEKRANWVPDGIVVHGPAQPHELPQSWEERVADSSECHYDSGNGIYADAGPWTPPDPKSGPATSRATARALLKRVWRATRRLIGL